MPRPNQSCSCGRGATFRAPAPLYTTLLERAERPAEAPRPLPVRPAAPEVEMRICRHSNPIPEAVTSAQSEMLCLLRRQNELLCEIVALLSRDAAAP